MPKKAPSEKQLAQRKAFGEAAKARAAARRNKVDEQANEVDQEVTPSQAQGSEAESVTLTQDQFKALMSRLDKVEGSQTETVKPSDTGFDQFGKPTGVIQTYSVNPADYADPRDFLYDLPELAQYAMRLNYNLDWLVEQKIFETKYGTSVAHPKFSLILQRKRLENGVEVVKIDPNTKREFHPRIHVQTGVFFEDPAASVTEALQLGLPIDKANTPQFLEQMRQLRYKTWLLDVFFPQPPTNTADYSTEQVIDGKVYQIENTSVVI